MSFMAKKRGDKHRKNKEERESSWSWLTVAIIAIVIILVLAVIAWLVWYSGDQPQEIQSEENVSTSYEDDPSTSEDIFDQMKKPKYRIGT